MFRLFLCLLLCWSVTEKAVAKEELKFLIPDYPPYTYQEQGHNKGIGYEAVSAIMADLQVAFSAELVPHFGRVVLELQKGEADGFFLATESVERNKVAVLSDSVMTIEWTWVWLKERVDLRPGSAEFKQQAQVSAQTNSNVYHWLKERNYHVTAGTTDIRGLINLLVFKRVDAILLPQLTINTLMEQQGTKASLLSFKHEINLPLGIYINKTYLQQHPDFMQRLNAAIGRYLTKVAADKAS
jgi:polar amino acid transport system substrate-binding protein